MAVTPQDLLSNEQRPPEASERIDQWFKQWRSTIRHWLSRHASVPAAELDDLAQDVFLRLLRYPRTITEVHNPLSYLLRTASNVASEWRERSRVARPHAPEWLDELRIEETQETEHRVSRHESNAVLQAAVDALPPHSRQAIILHVNEGMTYKAIAKALNRTPRMILRDLARGYSELRVKIRIEDID